MAYFFNAVYKSDNYDKPEDIVSMLIYNSLSLALIKNYIRTKYIKTNWKSIKY